jgi:hypothetical protein
VGRADDSELTATPRWCRTRNSRFPFAARVSGRWWVLRLNSFPDHPLWTWFIDGAVVGDTNDPPRGGERTWGTEPLAVLVGLHLSSGGTFLEASEEPEALAGLHDFEAHGSEFGHPFNDICSVAHPALTARPLWQQTGNGRFPVAAQVSGCWWVLRLNNFPDHPRWTVFIDGAAVCEPANSPALALRNGCLCTSAGGRDTALFLKARDAAKALRTVQDFAAYGSEIGQPCNHACCPPCHLELTERPRWPCWYQTRNGHFPFAALVNGRWWVLRLNNFPDHPLWTLFIDGAVVCDTYDPPRIWGKLEWDAAPFADAGGETEALTPVQDFVGFGSEIGCPCPGLCCP